MSLVLITAATTAAAYRLKNILNSDNVLLGDHMDLPDFMLKPGKLVRLPDPASGSYAHEMLTFCLDTGITKVYPLRPVEAALLAEAGQLFREFDITIIQPDEIQ